jgi:hemolysin activation/secretion protein
MSGHSAGVTPLLSAAYSVPLNTRATTLSLSYRKNDFLVVEELFRPLDVTSRSEIYGIGVRHPFVLSGKGEHVTREFALSADGEYLRNSSKLLGEPFSFSEGAVNGRYAIAALRFGQEFVQWWPGQVLAARSRISVGVSAFGSTVRRAAPEQTESGLVPDSRFVSWLGQLQLSRRLIALGQRRTEVLTKADVQLASEPLLPLEQFPLGGRFSVRGHRENALVRDQAMAVSAEWRVPVFRGGPLARLQLAPFFDYGYGADKGEPGRAIAGAGLGVRWAGEFGRGYGLRPTVEVYWGPFRYHRTPGLTGNLQDRGFHFQIGVTGS